MGRVAMEMHVCMYSRSTVPHARNQVGSFWWRGVMSFFDSFRLLATCKLNLGDTTLFWDDSWDLGVLRFQFPQLFSFGKNTNISVANKFLAQDAHHNFYTPISEIASDQLQS